MGPKLIHISKRGNWWSNPLDILTLVVLTINCLCKIFPDFAIKVLCFLTTINLTFKFQLMVHEKLSWRNCKCPVDLWQPGQIVLKKFHPSKNPAAWMNQPLRLRESPCVLCMSAGQSVRPDKGLVAEVINTAGVGGGGCCMLSGRGRIQINSSHR